MIACTLTFTGSTEGAHGMPEPFHSYFVVASRWKTGVIASIVPLSSGAPMPSEHHVFVRSESEEDAITRAEAALKNLDGNRALELTRSYSQPSSP